MTAKIAENFVRIAFYQLKGMRRNDFKER